MGISLKKLEGQTPCPPLHFAFLPSLIPPHPPPRSAPNPARGPGERCNRMVGIPDGEKV